MERVLQDVELEGKQRLQDFTVKMFASNFSNRELKAIFLAEKTAELAHAGQVDKSGHAYIEHPTAVATMVYEDGGSAAQVAIALLHDTVEDTTVTVDNIREWFGNHVAEAVDAISRRNDETLRQYLTRMAVNDDALFVKHRDIRHNTSSDRLAQLDEETQRHLRFKYERAIKILAGLAENS